MKIKFVSFFTLYVLILLSSCKKNNGNYYNKCFMSENYDIIRLRKEFTGNWKQVERYNPWEGSKVKVNKKIRFQFMDDYTFQETNENKILDKKTKNVTINSFYDYPFVEIQTDGSVGNPLYFAIEDKCYVIGSVLLCKNKELLIDGTSGDMTAQLYKKVN